MRKVMLLLIAIMTALFMGCTAVPNPMPGPSPTTAVAEAAPIVVERPSPTPTVTRVVEGMETAVVPAATSTHVHTYTPRPTRTVSPTPVPVSTATINWSETLQEVAHVNSHPIVWSPTANEFLAPQCEGPNDLKSSEYLFLISAPEFTPIDISPADVQCVTTSIYRSSFFWHPDGQAIIFDALPITEPGFLDYTLFWITDRQNSSLRALGTGGRWPVSLWVDNYTLAFSSYAGGGHHHLIMFDIYTEETYAWAHEIHLGSIVGVSQDYILTHIGADYSFDISAAVVGKTERPEPASDRWSHMGPYLRPLSFDMTQATQIFNSRVEDWRPETNEALVLTWGVDESLWDIDLVHDSAITDLQLWNVDSDQLTLLVPRSIYGRFSPNGQFLAFITPAQPSPYMQLLDRANGEVLFSLPASVPEVNSNNGYFVEARASYSPDSRYITFFTPESDTSAAEEVVRLEVYNLETQQFLFSLPARQYMPVWSPDGLRLVFWDGEGNLTLFDVGNGRSTPLALNGGSRLFNPQWSYDGAYLSVGIRQEDGGVETAVLRTP